MLETSKDLLNVILAISVAGFTVFLCALFFQVISMLRNMNSIMGSVKDKLDTVDKILTLIREKMDHGANHMGLLADSAIRLVTHFVDKQKKKTTSRAKKSTTTTASKRKKTKTKK